MADYSLTTIPQTVTMSSREIADLTGKRHRDVMRDIRVMLEKVGEDERKFARIYQDARGREQQEYALSQDLTYTLVLGYDPARRLKVVRRWIELETASPAAPFHPFDPSPFISMALAAFPNLSPVSVQTLIATTGAAAFGREVLPLPRVEEHFHTASEVGEMLGVSANAIGRAANAHGLKTADNGITVMDKSRHSTKQVEAFRYNTRGIEALRSVLVAA